MKTKNVTQLAMESELAALERYLRLANEVRDMGAKDMFIHLAKDELTHFHTLRQMQDGKKASPPLDVETWDRLIDKVAQIGVTKVSAKKQRDALTLALEEEEKAHQIYTQEAERSDDESQKAIWLGLASMERGHAEILRRQIEELGRSGSWLDFLPVIRTRGSEDIIPPQG